MIRETQVPVIPTAVGPLAKRRLEVFAVATAARGRGARLPNGMGAV